MPLHGATVLITRARAQAGVLADLIHRCGGRVLEFPVIAIAPPDSWAPLDAALQELRHYRWLVITSQSGAESVAGRLDACGLGPEALSGVRVAAVGSATAKRLGDLGITVDLVPPEFRGAALPGALAPLLQPGDRVLMPRGDLADPALATALRGLGLQVDDLVAYRTVRPQGDARAVRQALEQGQVHYVTFTSSSTVAGLLERVGGSASLGRTRIACIGPETRQTAIAAGLMVHVVPPEATLAALVKAVEADFEATQQGGEKRS